MRALVLRGFCIGVGLYAEVGQVVDIPEALFKIMKSQGAVEPAKPEPAPAADPAPPVAKAAAAATDPTAADAASTKQSKGAAAPKGT